MSKKDKPMAPSVAAAAKTLKAALMILSETGERMPVSAIIKAVEQRLTFTPWELIVNEKTRDVKWMSILKFYSINAVKSNLITRGDADTGKGWMITDTGREIAQLSEVEILQYVRVKYKEWADENLPPKRTDSAKSQGKRNYWTIQINNQSALWNDFIQNNTLALSGAEYGDLSIYKSREELADEASRNIQAHDEDEKSLISTLWMLSSEMKVGDYIFVASGKTHVLGYGVVSGNYEFNEEDIDHPHTRPVQWKSRNEITTNQPVSSKMVSNITKYKGFVRHLKERYEIDESSSSDTSIKNYYLLCANPKIWKMSDMAIGEEQFYTSINENGNKRQRYENFQNLKKGDLLLGYESGPEKCVKALFEVTQELHFDESLQQDVFYFKLLERISDGMNFESLSGHPKLQDAEYLPNIQGSLFKLTQAEFEIISDSQSEATSKFQPYGWSEFESEVFIQNDIIRNAIRALHLKKNIILQGSPGVGKSYVAKRIAYLMMEEKDDRRIGMVQFHQSYSYEDFVQGFRPNEDGNFKLTNGVFYQFCLDASSDPGNDYYFIIDEINRGNLSKIFGELMLLIEHDKRNPHYAVSLTYGSKAKAFNIPPNVHIIGTMNTADRSLALVDYALRRRFAFIHIEPSFNGRFQKHLKLVGIDDSYSNKLIAALESVNEAIEQDRSLGSGFKIGHSYFCAANTIEQPTEWLRRIIDLEIEPLLREYWFDNDVKWKIEIQKLRALIR
jgi:5-methylcytosine-specific restriction protein B